MEELSDKIIKHQDLEVPKFIKNINKWFIAIGSLILIIAFLIYKSRSEQVAVVEIAFWLILTIGVTFISNSIYALVLYDKKTRDDNKVNEKFFEINYRTLTLLNNELKYKPSPGLVGIHKKDDSVFNRIINEMEIISKSDCLSESSLDIICYNGLKNFAAYDDNSTTNSTIISYLKKGHKIRILTVNPNLDYISQAHLDRNMSFGGGDKRTFRGQPTGIKGVDSAYKARYDEIEDMEKWATRINGSIHDSEGKIIIKYYNSLPTLHYFRIGDILFISNRTIAMVKAPENRFANDGE